MDRLRFLVRWWSTGERRCLNMGWSPAVYRALILALLLLLGTGLALNAGYLRGMHGLEPGIPNDDVFAYECYARGFWQGTRALQDSSIMRYCSDPRWLFWTAPPQAFHTLPREYPAPALLWFSLPLLWFGGVYPAIYITLVALIELGTVAYLAWRRLLLCAVACGAYVFIAGWGTALERYDLVPGVLVLAALILAERSRYGLAYLLLAAAALLKVYPGAVALVVGAHQWRTTGRPPWQGALLFLSAIVVGAGPFAVLNPSGFLAPLHYNSVRPPQIESVPGSLLWLSGKIGGDVRVRLTYHSVNAIGTYAGLAATLSTMLLVVGVLMVVRRAWRGCDSLARSVVLVLLVILCTSKMLSPQYLLWLFPVVAYVEGLRLRWILVATLTLLIFPFAYRLDNSLVLLPQHPLFMGSILARNLVLLAITLLYLLPLPARGRPARLFTTDAHAAWATSLWPLSMINRRRAPP